MKKSIFITAVAGTGKSAVCVELKRLGYASYDIETIPGLFTLYEIGTSNILKDPAKATLELAKRSDWRCDKLKLQNIINSEQAEVAFYCGASNNRDEIMDLFDTVVLLIVSDETSRSRLQQRHYGQFGHTKEVQDWIMSWKHNTEEHLIESGSIPISAEESARKVAQSILQTVLNSKQGR